jgi:hypothetical protein
MSPDPDQLIQELLSLVPNNKASLNLGIHICEQVLAYLTRHPYLSSI